MINTGTADSLAKDLLRRRNIVLVMMASVFVLLLWRVVYLQIFKRDFLMKQGAARHLRVVAIKAYRGMITDRMGEPLAISSPVKSVWIDPRIFVADDGDLQKLARVLSLDPVKLKRRISRHVRRKSEFLYVKRQIPQSLAARVAALNLKGVNLMQEYKRYYPTGEVNAHVVGFTNVDDKGQEGIELAFDRRLSGSSGEKRVRKDRIGHIVEDVERIRPTLHGKPVRLSIDHRLQYLSYRILKNAVKKNKALSGSLVILDIRTGEILAMVNQPSYNPNDRSQYFDRNYRNRAVTDLFEPGSTIKPFVIAAALQSKKYTPATRIDTRPGRIELSGRVIHDTRNYGVLSLAKVLIKSSNIGTSRVALKLGAEVLWKQYRLLGFGQSTHSGFPGEASGVLNHYRHWNKVETASHSFGYGLSVTILQLAQAYMVLGNDGVRKPVSILRRDGPVFGRRVIHYTAARDVRRMLEKVVSAQGTGRLAAIDGYRVAGKTGTVKKLAAKGYSDKKYLALFAGFVPASRPRLVCVVLINEPRAGEYYGGKVAAPVFSEVMKNALRILNIAPDRLPVQRRKSAGTVPAGVQDGTEVTRVRVAEGRS